MLKASSIEIIDSQDEFLIVYKPANLNFHDEGEVGEGLFNQIKALTHLSELYPVHRLDKMTSGLVIVAKTLNAAQQFQTLFSAHAIEKYYLAISDKKPIKKQGLIKGDMKKSRRSAWKLLRSTTNPAISQFFSHSIGEGKRLYIIKPHSGKTHQIRVALSSVGAPILGDKIYSGNDADRGYLHAYAINFTIHGKEYHYEKRPHEGELFTRNPNLVSEAQWDKPWDLPWPKI